MIRARIPRDGVFDREALQMMLQLPMEFLDEQISKGFLRGYYRGGQELFFGRDVQKWIETGWSHNTVIPLDRHRVQSTQSSTGAEE
jgi:hypothetical protein